MTRAKSRWVAVFAVLTIALMSSPALANFVDADGDGAIYRANNQYHWFAYAPTVGPPVLTPTEDARTGDFEPTRLDTSYHGAGVGDSTDWDIYFEACYDSCMSNPGFDGEVDCRALIIHSNGNKECYHWHVFYNSTYTDTYSSWRIRGLACHEIGHTVGLLHTDSNPSLYECMEKDTPDRSSNRLGDHNAGHINDYY